MARPGVGEAAWEQWSASVMSAQSPKWRDSHVSLKLDKKAVLLLEVNSVQAYCQRNIQAKTLVLAAAAFLNRALFHCHEGWTRHGGMTQAGRMQFKGRKSPSLSDLSLARPAGSTVAQGCGQLSCCSAMRKPCTPESLHSIKSSFAMLNLHTSGITEHIICIRYLPPWPPNHLWSRGIWWARKIMHFPNITEGGTGSPNSREWAAVQTCLTWLPTILVQKDTSGETG